MTSESWNNWQTIGFLVIPGDNTGKNPSRCIAYFNGKKKKERIDTSWDGDSTWRESRDTLGPDEVGYVPMPGLRHHRYMVIIGSGQWKTQWDWVRVWQSPKITANDLFCANPEPVTIDGIADEAWQFVHPDTVKKEIQGSPQSEKDLSALYKAKWDSQAIYFLIAVEDDSLINDSPDHPQEDDGIEVFIDGNNDKDSVYDANDHHYIFRWNEDTVYDHQHSGRTVNPPGVTFARKANAKGYTMEIQITWSALGVEPADEHLIGFDLHVNDDDNGGTLDKKMGSIASHDLAQQKPSAFGTILLDQDMCGACKVLTHPENNHVNFQADAFFSVEAKNALTYRWQVKEGSEYLDLSNNTTYRGVQTDTLEVIKATEALGRKQYRCIVSNTLGKDTSRAALLIPEDLQKPAIFSVPDDQTLVTTEGCKAILPDYTGEVMADDNHDDSLDITQIPEPGAAISKSEIKILLKATDDYGNTAEKTFKVKVTDRRPPVISSTLQDQILEAGPECQALLPDYTGMVSITDNCYRTHELKITQTPPKNTYITDTARKVTLSAADPDGNSSQVSFMVYLKDSRKPTLTCPPDQTINLQQGQTHYTIPGSGFDPVSLDENCGIASMTNSLNGSRSLEGMQLSTDTTVLWTVTDRSGNQARCSFDIITHQVVGMKSIKKNGIRLYPNPAAGMLHYESNQASIHHISLLDITGTCILEMADPAISGSINISHVTKGIYFIEMTTGKGRWTYKIIKK